jgi:nucleotide-binding universal stress UspA family protein
MANERPLHCEVIVMFKKIVLATDLSPAWDEIVACGAEFRALGCSQVILTHIITSEFSLGLETAWRQEAEPKLEVEKRLLEDQGLEVIVEMPLGLPGYSLNDVAARHCASLIVVGSHGRSLWRENVLGSTASAVLHHTRYPVLLLKVKVKKEEARTSCRFPGAALFQHVLYLTDFSEIAETAFTYLEKLAPRGLAQVTILHAAHGKEVTTLTSPLLGGIEVTPQQYLQALKERLVQAGVAQVNTQIASGPPLPIIQGAWLLTEFTLILMGTQGKGLIKEILLGSVANNVARLAPCPVLLIPRTACATE